MAARRNRGTPSAAGAASVQEVQPGTRTLRTGGVRGFMSSVMGKLGWGNMGSGSSYLDAASRSKVLPKAEDIGPNGANGDIPVARARSRKTYVNNSWYRNLINALPNNAVDYGMHPVIPFPELKELWDTWALEADARGQLTYYAMQWVVIMTTARDGEVIVRRRMRETDDMLSGVPLQLQLMEADHLPIGHTQQNPRTGNWIVDGVERNAIERAVGYWLYPYHPLDWRGRGGGALNPQYVPAADIAHIMTIGERIGAERGTPWAASALMPVEGAKAYSHSERQRKETQANYSVFYTKPIDEEEGFAGKIEYDGEPVFAAMQPNTAIEVPEGYKVEFPHAAPVDNLYADFQRWNLSEASVSVGFPVELATLNFDGINDRQARVMNNEVKRRLGVIQYHVLGPLNQKVWQWFVTEVIAAKLWTPPKEAKKADYMRVRWMAPPRGHIHPVQEVNAYKEAVKAGFMSRSEVASEHGEDAVKIDMENAADQARARQLKLSYSVYPDLNGESPPLPSTAASEAVDGLAADETKAAAEKLGAEKTA